MQLILSSGTEFCGDLLLDACLHSGLEPMPMTLEAVVIRATDATIAGLKQGASISVANEGCVFRVVQVKRGKI
ncbi:hypothetical protein BCF11_4459 [Collimonas sp. PA-H2]|uniref:hypothetical protein n=1 Tax=Collimonas sp. PA-H2 TaxID=1881062 RepID=UPI000BF37533|nr:hypothetical protein [Collimonas sp. PA-H2]PFH11987.1 hypothetical protein BCF11_4459 [Collimonas sp. PA-H2]